ncbi:MAG: transcriptional regulator [Treponema sp.]|nr:transcriptional regulator [Treponema sp.]
MYKLILCIVPHESGEFITSAARQAGAGGGTVLMGRGTASSNIMQLLGLGDTSKDITLNVVTDDLLEAVRSKIQRVCEEKKAHFGVMVTMDADGFLKAGGTMTQKSASEKKGDKDMEQYELINVIVNKGYAEDAMAAARKAGAGGGTIIGARGTAKEGDSTFFGVEIVPEKEMLMILVPQEKKQDIVKAISELSCFAKAGSGIIFCQTACDFTLLGK